MGLILPPRRVSADSSGNGRNGAKLRIYDAGTTTLSSVYSDAALSTPLTNPVVANSSGVFPPIYAAEGSLFDITEQTSGGSTLYSEDDVPAIGVDSGSWSRDFTNSRAKISGTAGVVSFAAGDPAGDDVGGKWKLTGWNGTQATTGSLDAAAISMTGTLAVEGAATLTGAVEVSSTLNAVGAITENGKKLPGVVYTPKTSFSAASTVDIALPNAPSGVRGYRIDFWDLAFSTSQIIKARLAYEGGAVKTGADYAYNRQRAIASINASQSYAATAIDLVYPSDPGYKMAGYIELITPNSGAGDTILRSWFASREALNVNIFTSTGFGFGDYGRATTLRFYPDSGTISGAYCVTPLRGIT